MVQAATLVVAQALALLGAVGGGPSPELLAFMGRGRAAPRPAKQPSANPALARFMKGRATAAGSEEGTPPGTADEAEQPPLPPPLAVAIHTSCRSFGSGSATRCVGWAWTAMRRCPWVT